MEGFSLANLLTDMPLNIINILLLYLIVSKLVYKPVKKMLEERTARLAAQQQEVADARAEADEKARRYEELMTGAAGDAAQIRESARAEAAQNAAAVLAAARANAARLEEDARKRADAEHDAVLKGMQDEVAALAAGIAEKVLQRSVTDADTRRIAEDFFAALPSQTAPQDDLQDPAQNGAAGEDLP